MISGTVAPASYWQAVYPWSKSRYGLDTVHSRPLRIFTLIWTSMHRSNPAWLWTECLNETEWQNLLDLQRPIDFLRTALSEYGKALYNKVSSISVFCESRKTPPKGSVEKSKKGRACCGHWPQTGSWRRRWDSNSRAREDNLISSQARYDHFDTPPYYILIHTAFRRNQGKV